MLARERGRSRAEPALSEGWAERAASTGHYRRKTLRGRCGHGGHSASGQVTSRGLCIIAEMTLSKPGFPSRNIKPRKSLSHCFAKRQRRPSWTHYFLGTYSSTPLNVCVLNGYRREAGIVSRLQLCVRALTQWPLQAQGSKVQTIHPHHSLPLMSLAAPQKPDVTANTKQNPMRPRPSLKPDLLFCLLKPLECSAVSWKNRVWH